MKVPLAQRNIINTYIHKQACRFTFMPGWHFIIWPSWEYHRWGWVCDFAASPSVYYFVYKIKNLPQKYALYHSFFLFSFYSSMVGLYFYQHISENVLKIINFQKRFFKQSLVGLKEIAKQFQLLKYRENLSIMSVIWVVW